MAADENTANRAHYADLTALYVNCTLKRSPETGNTEGLIDRSRAVMESAGARTSLIRAVDHDLATGVRPDMTDHGWESDQHLGYAIPPQADAGWIGEAGPGPSYLDPGSGGPENDFTNRNTAIMSWNLMHLAALLKRSGGIPAHGNQRSLWDAGCRFDFPNPEHR
ncbi:hypothetical protein OHA91_12440 [Streptomyces erythrochromogenes]|uniref:Flavodoxin n=1 Tax=Streptomyces erythrochromogenes TaxID=285574 RepID=A0ABZ1Q9B9_9ACTN|nr:hypothetical protein [Streptomyces erythrochromogenes]